MGTYYSLKIVVLGIFSFEYSGVYIILRKKSHLVYFNFSIQVTHVINFDFPLNPSDYIHRAGRVGRVGGCQVIVSFFFYKFLILAPQSGRVTSFVDNQGGVKVVQNLETAVRKNIEIQQVARNSF